MKVKAMFTGIPNDAFNRRIRRGLVLIALLLLSACSSSLLVQKTPPFSSYLLEWNDTLVLHANAQGPGIRLSSVTAAAGFEGPQIIYIRTPYQLEHYAYHRWVDAPARMLEPLLMHVLEGSGLFSAVLGPDSAARAELQLEVELLQLQQVFSHDSSDVQLALNVKLINADRGQLIASQLFSITEPVTEPSPYGGVQAANRATSRLLALLRDFLVHQPAFTVDDELSSH